MKIKELKKVVCVFAHPDDEAFGPSGTIALMAKRAEVYILCATKGEYGTAQNSEIGNIRAKELSRSARQLGVKKVYFLGFEDGTLSNNLYHALADKIQKKVNTIKPDALLTFEPRGISGHIDHIVVSMVTRFVFEKTSFVKQLFYFAISDKQRKLIRDYFIHFPDGYGKKEVSDIVDVSQVWEEKLRAIKEHDSQKADGDRIISHLEKLPKEEWFLVVKK